MDRAHLCRQAAVQGRFRPRQRRRDRRRWRIVGELIAGAAQACGHLVHDAERDFRFFLNAGEKLLTADGADGDRADSGGRGAADALIEDTHLAEHVAGVQDRQADGTAVALLGDFDIVGNDLEGGIAGFFLAEDDLNIVEGLFGFL